MAMAIGANGIDMEKVQVHPTGLVDPKEPEAKVKFLAAEALRGSVVFCSTTRASVLSTNFNIVISLLEDLGERQGTIIDTRFFHCSFTVHMLMAAHQFPIRLVLNGPASKEIEWHCKHYVGRGLMKRFENGDELSKEFGLKPEVLKKTFEDYNQSVRTNKDPFGKKFFSGEWKYDDIFNVAVMTPSSITPWVVSRSTTNPVSSAMTANLLRLFAAGEVAGGVHGANRLGGSSLLGCVVFGRVSGDSAAAYLLQTTGEIVKKAGGRLGALAGQLSSQPSTSGPTPSAPAATTSSPTPVGKTGQYTMEEVAKHTKKDDVWVVIEVPSGSSRGEKAIMLYAGRDATEEFNMLHDPKVIPRYAPDAVIGSLKK
ncbi:fumarate reductase [Salix suchowensis]|nr:fumarate reductase [Salix suchowensis]